MIEVLLDRLSRTLLLPVDQISAAFCLLLAFPFAFLLHFALFSVGPTYLFLWICFYAARDDRSDGGKLVAFFWDLLSVHFPIILTFLSIKYSTFMRGNPTILFTLLLLHLSYHHLSNQLHFYNQYTVSITGPLMVLIIKLSAFAYDVADKKISIESVGMGGFLAWCLMFAGFFTGPVVQYKEFESFCDNPRGYIKVKTETENHIIESESDTASVRSNSQALKGRKRRASVLILSASVLLIFSLALQPHFPTQNLLQVSESVSLSLWYKLFFMHVSLMNWRLKYYVAWMLAEGAIVIIGLGFVFRDNKVEW